MQISKGNTVLIISLGACLGLLSLVIPPYLIPGAIKVRYEAPLFPFLKTAFENLVFIPTLLSFFVVGFFLGIVQPQKWLLIGLSTIFVFPLVVILEVIISSTSHNLWPIELGIYLFFGLMAVVGAYLGRKIISKKGKGRARE